MLHHIPMPLGMFQGDISVKFSQNSELLASKFGENLTRMFPGYW